MRAAAILGLASSPKDLQPFQDDQATRWLVGMPASPDQADAVLLFGGDGTIHRYLSQLVRLGLPVLIVPAGSGNDFARALGLRHVRDSLVAWRKFCDSGTNLRSVDMGVIWPLETESDLSGPVPQGLKPAEENGPIRSAEALRHPQTFSTSSAETLHDPGTLGSNWTAGPVTSWKPETGDSKYFCCAAGVGLDGEVARRANRMPRWLRGHGGYALSLAPAILRFASLPMKILTSTIAGGEETHLVPAAGWETRSDQPTVLAVFANTPTYGGGMKVAPRARLDDGLLDVCLVRDISKLKLFSVFPSVYFGRHLSMAEVEYFQSERLRVETEHPLDVYADGEYVCRTPVEVGLQARALKVVTP